MLGCHHECLACSVLLGALGVNGGRLKIKSGVFADEKASSDVSVAFLRLPIFFKALLFCFFTKLFGLFIETDQVLFIYCGVVMSISGGCV